jgi:Protein of unknown function (DUF1570)
MVFRRSLRLSFSQSLILSVLVAIAARGIRAQQPPDDPPGRWRLETLTLKDKSQIHGLIQSETDGEIDFAQVIQPPGRPMYAVIRGIPREKIAKIQRLSEADHLVLFQRFALFRNRMVIEAGRMDQLELTSQSAEGQRVLAYAGPWFELTSTADDEQTRRCLVRIEQYFRAYRTLLPPRVTNPKPLRVQLFGSLDLYRDRLRDLKLDLDNAAFYSPREATILAASDLNLFAERLAQVRREHERVRKDLARLDAGHGDKLATLADELAAAGYSPDEITAEVRQRKASWKKELDATLATNVQRQRSAEQKFDVVTDKMFRSLAHESFHAWLDAFVYPHDRYDVPRWLNEGLAQVFESGQLDGDSLRLDAPDKQRLAALRADLASGQPLALAQILTASEREFLGPHAGAAPQRHYLYAWGLAHYLTFHHNLLASTRLDDYVAQSSARLNPIARFEQLAGRPLTEFEAVWRAAMLE